MAERRGAAERKAPRYRVGLILGVVLVAAVTAGLWTSSPNEVPVASVSATEAPLANTSFPLRPSASQDQALPRGPVATLPSSNLPPLPVLQFVPPRPMEVIRAVYAFAANHPEVLSRVPCFCGCENFGHGDNHDCFVADRDAEGRVTWESHGMG